jgi:hypothetical protein
LTQPPRDLVCRERLAHRRGVCPRCYAQHKKAVKADVSTWADLEAAGLVLPARAAGRA